MTTPPSPIQHTAEIDIIFEELRGWPHTPSPAALEKARQAHQNAYAHKTGSPISLEDFQLADTFQEILEAHRFSNNAIAAMTILRQKFPRISLKHHLHHLTAIALTGASESTIGIATVSHDPQVIRPFHPKAAEMPGIQLVNITQVLRDLDWLGFAPATYPCFKGTTALIIGHPESGQPQAAVGMPNQLFQEDPSHVYDQFPDHPETNALRIILSWHGATVQWMPMPGAAN